MTGAPTALYRHFDADGALLYVGASYDAASRLEGHRFASAWYQRIASIPLEWFPTKEEALAAKRAAILAECPLHNVGHKSRPNRIDAFARRRAVAKRKVEKKESADLVRQAAAVASVRVDRILRFRDVEAKLNRPRSSIYLMISQGIFPKAVKIGARAVGLHESTVDAWLASRG